MPGVLAEGEELGRRRAQETHEAGDLMGVSRVEFLGYRDSGMMDEPTNEHPRLLLAGRCGYGGPPSG